MEAEETFEIEQVDVEECLKRGEPVSHARRYIIRVDKQRVVPQGPHHRGRDPCPRPQDPGGLQALPAQEGASANLGPPG